MNLLFKFSLAMILTPALISCKEKTAPDEFLKEMFNQCDRTTEAPPEAKNLFCNCVAKDIVAKHSVDELNRMSRGPVNFMEMEKTRKSIVYCGEQDERRRDPSGNTQI